jgi:hypothetical protein
MHYGPLSFTKNGKPTIEALRPLPAGIALGQRVALSDGDVAAILKMYG